MPCLPYVLVFKLSLVTIQLVYAIYITDLFCCFPWFQVVMDCVFGLEGYLYIGVSESLFLIIVLWPKQVNKAHFNFCWVGGNVGLGLLFVFLMGWYMLFYKISCIIFHSCVSFLESI
jgi:hypothetical protein